MGSERNNFSATFNCEGEVKQVTFANRCAAHCSPAIGIRAKDAVILVAEKSFESSLAVASTVTKLEHIGSGMALSYAGIAPDFRVLMKSARMRNTLHVMKYRRMMTMKTMINKISSTMQEYAQTVGVRPFGLALLLVGWEKGHGRLYGIDASGHYSQYKAIATGRSAEQRTDFLEEHYHSNLTSNRAIHLGIQAIKMDCVRRLPADHYEIGICTEAGFKRLDEMVVQFYLRKVEQS